MKKNKKWNKPNQENKKDPYDLGKIIPEIQITIQGEKIMRKHKRSTRKKKRDAPRVEEIDIEANTRDKQNEREKGEMKGNRL